jgi:hypothetical protein
MRYELTNYRASRADRWVRDLAPRSARFWQTHHQTKREPSVAGITQARAATDDLAWTRPEKRRSCGKLWTFRRDRASEDSGWGADR